MAATITPAAIPIASYSIAQGARVGAEYEIYVCPAAGAGIVKRSRKVAASTYDVETYKAAAGGDLLSAMVVGQFGLTGNLASTTATVETVHLAKPLWSSSQSAAYHASGFAVAGTLPVAPATFDWGANGEIMYQADIPGWDPEDATPIWFRLPGVTNHKFTRPISASKSIADGMNGSRWTTRMRSAPVSLTLSTKLVGDMDGLSAFAGLRVSVMIRCLAQGLLEVGRYYILNWIPSLDQDAPEGDGDATLSAQGEFDLMAFIPAPGTAP